MLCALILVITRLLRADEFWLRRNTVPVTFELRHAWNGCIIHKTVCSAPSSKWRWRGQSFDDETKVGLRPHFANLVSARGESTKGRFSQRKKALYFTQCALASNFCEFVQNHFYYYNNNFYGDLKEFIFSKLSLLSVTFARSDWAAMILMKLFCLDRLWFFLKAGCREKHGLSRNEKEGFKWKRLCG